MDGPRHPTKIGYKINKELLAIDIKTFWQHMMDDLKVTCNLTTCSFCRFIIFDMKYLIIELSKFFMIDAKRLL